jgi:hypothetical protein
MVLLSYTISVGVPSVFILMKGLSSNSGDGVSEVTALAMESQPMEVLKNICAGVSSNRCSPRCLVLPLMIELGGADV